MKSFAIADLFCGAGGTSEGAVEAIRALGFEPQLTAINHWDVAIATHTANHPDARHLCTSLDNIDPRKLFKEDELQVLWASPECTHHSVARGGKPINDQSRATAWCVVRWAEALRPAVVLVENVPEFETWGAIGTNGRPLKTKRGATFLAWVGALESLGYTVDWRILCAADYGDPTIRRRLFIQCVRGRRKIVWPNPTHAPKAETDMFGSRKAWVPARDIIDWSTPGQSIFDRKRPLSPKTMRRIWAGLEKFGLKPFIVPQHGSNGPRSADSPAPTVTTTSRGVGVAAPYLVRVSGAEDRRARSIEEPLHTVTAGGISHGVAQPFIVRLQHNNEADSVAKPLGTVLANGTHFALAQPYLIHAAHGGDRRPRSIAEPMPTVAGNRGDVALCEPALLPQGGGGALRPISEPTPTIHCDGAVALVEPFLVEYYGTSDAQSLKDPLNTVTTKDRHALVRPVVIIDGERYLLDIRFRMLQPKELAAAQGFRSDYKFTGNKSDQVKQIGNAVPRRLARALVAAALTQNSDVSWLEEPEEKAS